MNYIKNVTNYGKNKKEGETTRGRKDFCLLLYHERLSSRFLHIVESRPHASQLAHYWLWLTAMKFSTLPIDTRG